MFRKVDDFRPGDGGVVPCRHGIVTRVFALATRSVLPGAFGERGILEIQRYQPQYLTGDYHKACFASIAAAGLCVERSDMSASCALCGDGVAAHSIIVRPGQLMVHLACFFVTPGNERWSLGAAAVTLTLNERSVALRQCARHAVS
jgi:hypothetical protein